MDAEKQKIPDSNKSFFKLNPEPPKSQKTKIFVGYCRCSTLLQANFGDSISTQENIIVRFCKEKQFYLYVIFYDEGISGAKKREDRPGLNGALKMLDDLKQAKYKCALMVIHQDRLFRSTYQITPLRQYFMEKGIGMYLVSMHCDVTKERKLEFEISAVIADNERSLISERVKNNIAYRKAKGILKTKTKFGESKNHNKQESHFTNDSEMEVVNYIKELRENDNKCKVSWIITMLDKKFPATNYRNISHWHHTYVQRIIAYYNIPGANYSYIHRKSKKNIESEDDETD